MIDDVAKLEHDGWLLVPGTLDGSACDQLLAAIGPPEAGPSKGGVRGLLALPAVAALVRSVPLRALVEPILGPGAFAVRGTLFDKVPSANWRVPWHRDRLVAVRRRVDAPGFSAWSVKDGVDHAEPPLDLLARMLAVRLHLDSIGPDNGPLRVLPGSHRELEDGPVDEADAVTVTAERGSAMVMWPLLRHASVPAATPGHRRVLHLEFAAEELPGGLEWHERR